jgi:cellobiose phosphorylase
MALAAVDRYLESSLGPLLYAPGYHDYDPEIGRISLGGSETDAVYVHAVMFKIQADLMCGRADEAFETICKVLPAMRRAPAGQTGAEPFCCVNSYAGQSWSWPGWSYTGWWTGSATWLQQIVVEWLFGARAVIDGLRIDPHLPSSWGNARITRHFRGAIYTITIQRDSEKPLEACRIMVNGQPTEGSLIKPAPPGTTVEIVVQCQG